MEVAKRIAIEDYDYDPIYELGSVQLDDEHTKLWCIYHIGGHAPLVPYRGTPKTPLGRLLVIASRLGGRFFNDGDKTWISVDFIIEDISIKDLLAVADVLRDRTYLFFADAKNRYEKERNLVDICDELGQDVEIDADWGESKLSEIISDLLDACKVTYPYTWSDEEEAKKRKHLKSLKQKGLEDDIRNLENKQESIKKELKRKRDELKSMRV